MELEDQQVVKTIWIVKQNTNLTAYDTFNEDTFEGPTNVTDAEYGFLTEEEALNFYCKGKQNLMFAGSPGMYWTYPKSREISSRHLMVLECKGEDESYYHIACPATRVICHACDGDGTELCGGLKGAAFSTEEMNEDPDFCDSYFSGDYDVQCSTCKGEKIILEPDESGLPHNLMEDYMRFERERQEYEAEERQHARNLERGIHS